MSPEAASKISAVVPTWNESRDIEATLESLRVAGVAEIVVVDGGSTDDTVCRAEPLADLVLEEPDGLFRQLNLGASRTTGDVLVFHYADVGFPKDGVEVVRQTLARPEVLGGAFRLRFASQRFRYRFTAAAANLRNRVGLGPFGDQSLFVRAATFRHLGGFNHGAFFEDLAMVRALRRQGKFRVVGAEVEVSVRRWESLGYLRTLASHYGLYALYFTRFGRATRSSREKAQSLRAVR